MLIKTISPINTKGSVTFLVAASDAPSSVKAIADYICSGTNDDVQIQAAIDAISEMTTGGTVVLSRGEFYISSTVTWDFGGLAIVGQGVNATILKLANNANCNLLEFNGGSSKFFFHLDQVILDGNKANNTSGSGLVTNSYLNDGYLSHLFIKNFSDDGMYIVKNWGWCYYGVVSEFNEGYGMKLGGASGDLMNCKLMQNVKDGLNLTSSSGGCFHINNCQLKGGDGYYAVTVVGPDVILTNCSLGIEDSCTNQGGVALADTADRVVIIGCTIDSKGTKYGINPGSGTDSLRIIGCSFPNIGAGAIRNRGTNAIIQGCSEAAEEITAATKTVSVHENGKKFQADTTNNNVTLTLPATKEGLEFEFYVSVVGNQLRIDPDGTEQIYEDNTGKGAGKYIWADAVGESVRLRCLKAGRWEMVDKAGTWTAEA